MLLNMATKWNPITVLDAKNMKKKYWEYTRVFGDINLVIMQGTEKLQVFFTVNYFRGKTEIQIKKIRAII